MPEEIAKLLAQFKSAATRHIASTAAASADGGSSAANKSAKRLLFCRFLPSLRLFPKRIRTTMEM